MSITARICVCEATRFEFNLNEYIRFKPTEFGKTIYKLHWLPYTRNNEEREISLDTDGWAKLQLWEFMTIYGAYMHIGMNMPVEKSVILINETAELLSAINKSEKHP